MKRSNDLYLSDILECIELIEEYTKGLNEDNLQKDEKVQDAVTRRLEIIGEAAKNISDDFKKKTQNIPWRDIAGFRDIIVHSYYQLNVGKVWHVIKFDLPKLKEDLKKAGVNIIKD
jgi:uncharacterized protein with HEPN domain